MIVCECKFHPVSTTRCKDLKKQKRLLRTGYLKYKCKWTFVRILCTFALS